LLSKLSLFVVFHKPHILPKADYIKPIQAGTAFAEKKLSNYTDFDGENIGNQNKYFAELTALYSIWKNKYYYNSEYWGLAHYRRFFCKELHWTKIKKKKLYNLPVSEKSLHKIFSKSLEHFFQKNLTPNTIILPKKQQAKPTKEAPPINLKTFYQQNHVQQDWELLEQTIKKVFPNYHKSFVDVGNQTEMLFFNMMIAHKDVWDNYAAWLFTILFEMQKNKTSYDTGYQERVYGFLAERLLQVYLHHHAAQYKFVYMPVAILK
jgi:hypothetical protein